MILDFIIIQTNIWKIRKLNKQYSHLKQSAINRKLGLPPPQTSLQKITKPFLIPLYKWKLLDEKVPEELSLETDKKPHKYEFFHRIWMKKLTKKDRDCLKVVGNHFIGLLIGWSVFIFDYYLAQEDHLMLIIKSSIMLIFISLSMAFVKYIRCLMLVALPMISSTRSRAILSTFLIIGLINGPLRNARLNLIESWESFKCGARLGKRVVNADVKGSNAYKWTSKLFGDFQDAFKHMNDVADGVAKQLDIACDKMTEMIEQLKEIKDAIVSACNDKFNVASAKCIYLMERMNKTAQIGMICHSPETIRETICALDFDVPLDFTPPLRDLGRRFRNVFKVKVTLKKKYETTITDQSRGNLTAIFQQYADIYYNFIEWPISMILSFNLITYLMYFLWIFRGFLYIRRFRNQDSFDNHYIDDNIQDLEVRRLRDKLPTIMPLTWKQKSIFIRVWTLRMTKLEYRCFLVNLTFFVIICFQVLFFFVLDYIVYLPLNFVSEILSGMNNTYPLPTVQMDVEGRGPVKDYYEVINSGAKGAAKQGFREATSCVPMPNPPNRNFLIGTLFELGFIFLTILIEPYSLRTQHIVAGWLYPLRKLTRTAWLYSYIMATKPISRKVAENRSRGDKRAKKTPFIYRLAIMNPCFRKILSLLHGKIVFCAQCARVGVEGDQKRFVKCSTPGCSGIFCRECLAQLQAPCPVCNHQAACGEGALLDAEVDSSEQESQIEYKYVRSKDLHPPEPSLDAKVFSDDEFLQNLDYVIPERASSTSSSDSLGDILDEEIKDDQLTPESEKKAEPVTPEFEKKGEKTPTPSP